MLKSDLVLTFVTSVVMIVTLGDPAADNCYRVTAENPR